MSDFTKTLKWPQVPQEGLTSLKLTLSAPTFASLQTIDLDNTDSSYDLIAPGGQFTHWELIASYGDETKTLHAGDEQAGVYPAPSGLVVKYFDSIVAKFEGIGSNDQTGGGFIYSLGGLTIAGEFEVPYVDDAGAWILFVPNIGTMTVTDEETGDPFGVYPLDGTISISPNVDDDTLTYFDVVFSCSTTETHPPPVFQSFGAFGNPKIKLGYKGMSPNTDPGSVFFSGGSARIL